MSPFVANRLSRFATAPEVTIVLLSSAPTVSRSMTSPANLKPDDPTRRDATRAARSRGRSTRDNPTRRDATLLEGTQSSGGIDDPTRRDATELPSTDSLSTSVPTEFRDDRLRRLWLTRCRPPQMSPQLPWHPSLLNAKWSPPSRGRHRRRCTHAARKSCLPVSPPLSRSTLTGHTGPSSWTLMVTRYSTSEPGLASPPWAIPPTGSLPLRNASWPT